MPRSLHVTGKMLAATELVVQELRADGGLDRDLEIALSSGLFEAAVLEASPEDIKARLAEARARKRETISTGRG